MAAARLWQTAQRWLEQRFRLLEAAAADDAKDAERWLKVIEAGNPLTAGNLIGMALVALGSILPPLFKLFG